MAAAATHDFVAIKDVMVVLGTAAVVVPVVQRLKMSPVLGFLLAGAVLGPYGLGRFADRVPALSWITAGGDNGLGLLGELGVVFLLFLIGLELSIDRLITLRRLVFGLGGAQVALSAIVIGLVASVLGASGPAATIIGLSLALSSTAIVLELLSQQSRMASTTGRASFAILLFQDLAVVPLLLLVSLLEPGHSGSLAEGLAKAFGQAALVILAITAVGKLVLRPLFHHVAKAESRDLFTAAVLLVAVGSGIASAAAGMSMALGAFVAGLLLAETEFRRAVEMTTDPFKGLLLGIFFFTVGMSIDLEAVLADPLPVVAGIVGLVTVKALITGGLVRAFGMPVASSIKTGLLMGPGGEFAFIVIGLAMGAAIVTPETGALVLAVTSVSMALIPVFDILGQRLAKPHEVPLDLVADPGVLVLPPLEEEPRAIIIGHGRVGQLVSDMLAVHKVKHVVTERSAALVSVARKEGRPVYYGDGKNPEFLVHCGLRKAKAVIITMHTWSEIDELVDAVRAADQKIVIVARARDSDHARRLYELGVTDAVPETVEASLQLSEAALVGLGVPTGPVIASIHEKRDEFRHALQKAAGEAGRTSRGLRAKTRKDG